MPMTKGKELGKSRKVLHPNSRKTAAIIKKNKKVSNRQKSKLGKVISQNIVAEKMMWLRDHMTPNVSPYTPELTAELLQLYIARHNEELDQIAIKHSIGGKRMRQHASREDILRMTKAREQEEYDTCGIEIPDVLNSTQCDLLRTWEGELRYLPNFKFRRFGKKHLKEHLKKQSKQKESSTNEIKKGTQDEPEQEFMDVK
ncbi:translation machinery-associated protein 16 [Orussus abietinus]|uniref:translation machinery-associated protein 16 n=1 Tax=Orussus abietinus TaxID=222816 RepID=UPI0006265882|nr:translation machinery-associated protein 16 [Orussus abietinus]XP_012276327.1 translation machinery-associated protein 16 [Orussus abietinus]